MCLINNRHVGVFKSPHAHYLVTYYFATASFRALPALKAAVREAGISISSFVCGTRPLRAGRSMTSAVKTIIQRNGLSKENVDWVVPHQANINIEASVAERIGISRDHVMVNIDHMANTSGGTLPLCLWEYEPRLKKGDNIVFTSFGAGFTWGASYMIWGYDGADEAAKEPAQFYKEGLISREEWYKLRSASEE